MTDVDEVASRLYALPPEQFTAARDEEAARVAKAGDRDAAKRIAALRKPTVAAWLVNLLAAERADELAELFALGEALRSAQHDLRGAQLRELSSQRRAAVEGLAGQVRGLARAAGRPGSANLPLDEVVATLNAALADAEVAAQVRGGRLARSASYAGFGEVPKPVLRVIDGTPEPEPEEKPRGSARAARAAAAQEKLRAAQTELAQAEEGYQAARAGLDEVAERLARVQQEQAAAQTELSRATLRRKSAQRAVTQLSAASLAPGGA